MKFLLEMEEMFWEMSEKRSFKNLVENLAPVCEVLDPRVIGLDPLCTIHWTPIY